MEAEDPDIGQRSGPAAFVFGPGGVRTVFDHQDVSLARHFHDRVHIAALAVQVDDDNRLSPLGDLFDHRGRIEIQRPRIDIRENNLRTQHSRRVGGGDPTDRSSDHFIARLQAGGDGRKLQPSRAGGDRQPVSHTAIAGERFFEFLDLRPAGRRVGSQHLAEGCLFFRPVYRALAVFEFMNCFGEIHGWLFL